MIRPDVQSNGIKRGLSWENIFKDSTKSVFLFSLVKLIQNRVEEPMKSVPVEDSISSTKKEKVESSKVQWSVYVSYFTAVGFHWVTAIVALSGLSIIFTLFSDIWLAKWSEDKPLQGREEQDLFALLVKNGIHLRSSDIRKILSKHWGYCIVEQ